MLRLRYERIERGWTQTVVGHLAQIPQPVISLLETGYLRPRPDQLERLARVLAVPADELLKPVLPTESETEAVAQ